jgi:hypothetical protein
MSHEAVTWALDIPRLRPAWRLVLIALAERADPKGGSCFPGITELTRRASTSRRRIIEAVRELEKIGAIQVHRSKSADGKINNRNLYQLAVGKQIEVPKKPAKPAAKKGTTLVPPENQGGSPGGTVTFTEPPANPHSDTNVSGKKGTTLVPPENQGGSPGGTVTFTEPPANPHSDTNVSARRAKKSRDEDLAQCDETPPPPAFPDQAMIAAAQTAGVDPEDIQGWISDYRDGLFEDARRGDRKSLRQYRTLWFRLLNGKASRGELMPQLRLPI